MSRKHPPVLRYPFLHPFAPMGKVYNHLNSLHQPIIWPTNSMDEFVKLKDEGLALMNESKFSEAIPKFSDIISRIPTETDEQTVLKCVALMDRSMCHLLTKDTDAALADADAIIEVYKEKRPESEKDVATNPEKLQNDPLIPVLAMAYLRRGQVFESRALIYESLQEYALSSALKLDEESQEAMRRVMKRIGIPEIQQTDEELRPFGLLLLHFLNELNFIAALTELMKYLQETNLSSELVQKFNETGVGRILIGALQVYIEKEVIVVGCLTSIRMLAEKGVGDVFNGFPVIRLVMDKWKGNVNVIGNAIRLMSMAPPELYMHLARMDFVTPACDALDLELSDDEFEAAFYLLFQLAMTAPIVTQFAAEDIVGKIFAKKSDSGFMLFTKLTQLKDVAVQAEAAGVIPWAFEKLGANDQNITAGALLILASVFASADVKPELAAEAFDKVVPLIRGATKDNEIVANGYAALAMCVRKAPQKVTEHQMVRASSAILAIHQTDALVAQNIVTFLYEVAEAGLVSEITEVRPVLPTVMNVLKAFAQTKPIVERAVAIAVHCNHPNKEELVKAGIAEFPDSKILRNLAK